MNQEFITESHAKIRERCAYFDGLVAAHKAVLASVDEKDYEQTIFVVGIASKISALMD